MAIQAEHGFSLWVAREKATGAVVGDCGTLDALWPEPTLTADGAWWHPVVIANPAMQVASVPLPLVTVLAVISATLGDPSRDRGDALVAFGCT